MKENSRKVLFRRSEHLSHEFSICALCVRGVGHPRRCAPVRTRRAHADARRAQHHATRLAHVGRARQLFLPPRCDELTAACKGVSDTHTERARNASWHRTRQHSECTTTCPICSLSTKTFLADASIRAYLDTFVYTHSDIYISISVSLYILYLYLYLYILCLYHICI